MSIHKMEYSPKKDIIKELKFLLVLLTVCGLFPRVKSDKSKRKLQLHSFQGFIVIVAVLVIGNIIFYFYTLHEDFHCFLLVSATLETENINQFIELSLIAFTITVIFAVCVCKKKDQATILNKLLFLDENLIKYEHELPYKVRRYFAILLAIPFFSIRLGLLYSKGIILGIGYVYFLVVLVVCLPVNILIICLLQVIVHRLKLLNLRLESFNERKVECCEFTCVVLQNEHIEEIIEDMNRTYGLVTFVTLVYACYSTIGDAYLVVGGMMDSEGFDWNNFTPFSFWLLTILSLMSALSVAGGNAQEEAKKTAEILSRAYGKGKDYQNIIDKFLTKSIRQETKFTAYGFFVIDNSTLFKIVSAVTTYLVILIQFKQLEESQAEP